jgi:hypothetical protein
MRGVWEREEVRVVKGLQKRQLSVGEGRSRNERGDAHLWR